MNIVNLEQVLKEASVAISVDEVVARVRAVAAAPVSLVDGPALDLVIPDIDAAANARVKELIGQMVTETIDHYDQETAIEQASARVAALREELDARGLDGFVVPMTDEHQNEFVPRHAQRLGWLSGFTGSAGTIVVLADKAALFVDGRYTLQAQEQVDLDTFETSGHDNVSDWLTENLSAGQTLGYDPWLHSEAGAKALRKAVEAANGILTPVSDNPVDAVWTDRPAVPLSRIVPHDLQYAGEASEAKRKQIAERLGEEGADTLVLSAPDSIGWLFNVRGGDVARTPLPLAFATLASDGKAQLFVDIRKCENRLDNHLGPDIALRPIEEFSEELSDLGERRAKVLVDPKSSPSQIIASLEDSGAEVVRKPDPCQKPKAIKNDVEIDGTRAAHCRDGVALAKFLQWLGENSPLGDVDELTAVETLRGFRQENDLFRDLSFDTIAGSGPNGAIVHYRVNEASNRLLKEGELFLLDSGAQYLDGTTDVTRTVAIGAPSDEQRDRFTRVLKGHIALARARFPKGTTGHQLDVLARNALWQIGLDFKHGTGHGVGSYLGVHEGPQSISTRHTDIALEPGMILSDEPGYYKTGEYGIRIENLVAVVSSTVGVDEDPFFEFETLTLAPIDLGLVVAELLTDDEREWLNSYHARVLETIGPNVEGETLKWLERATRRL